MDKKRIFFGLISIIFAFIMLIFFREAFFAVLSIVVFAAILAYLLFPFIKPFEKRIPGAWGIILGLVTISTICVTAITLLVPVFIEQVKNFAVTLPAYIGSINVFIDRTVEKFPFLERFVSSISFDESIVNSVSGMINSFSPAGIISVVSTAFLVPAVMYYILKEREHIKQFFIFMIPGKARIPVTFIFKDINRQLRDYIFGEIVVVIVVSGLMAASLGIFGFEFWLILGIIMGIFNIIPYIGPVIGSLPILFTAATGGMNRMWLALIIILIVQQIDNLIIQPRIISGSVKIHPAIVLLCVVFGSSVGSFIGMVLAIPAYIILRILLKELYRFFSERRVKFVEINKI